jgi:hypothetical protein
MDGRLNINIEGWRGKFQGQRVWIVGSGPSLDKTPLDMLVGEYSFGINRIGSVFDKTTWRPQFFMCATGRVVKEDYRNDVLRAVEACEIAIFCDRLLPVIGDKIPLRHHRKVLWLNCLQNSSEHNEPQDSWWNPLMIEKGRINNFGTTAFGCTQIAAYLGFSTIVLVGCDMGYKGFKPGEPDPNHYGDNYESKTMPQAVHDLENPRRYESHEITRRRASKVGIEIVNATLGGDLEAYPRVDFFDLVGEK